MDKKHWIGGADMTVDPQLLGLCFSDVQGTMMLKHRFAADILFHVLMVD